MQASFFHLPSHQHIPRKYALYMLAVVTVCLCYGSFKVYVHVACTFLAAEENGCFEYFGVAML